MLSIFIVYRIFPRAHQNFSGTGVFLISLDF